MPTKLITQVTRRKIFDTIPLPKVYWPGRLEEPDFLARVYGQSKRSVALTRHARLALNATVTIAEFVLDTWQARVAAGRLKLGD